MMQQSRNTSINITVPQQILEQNKNRKNLNGTTARAETTLCSILKYSSVSKIMKNFSLFFRFRFRFQIGVYTVNGRECWSDLSEKKNKKTTNGGMLDNNKRGTSISMRFKYISIPLSLCSAEGITNFAFKLPDFSYFFGICLDLKAKGFQGLIIISMVFCVKLSSRSCF